ncbi:uncharacterized protein LOC133921431 [Phragmites australis]|uniref:uncharacterized protein LOC133921431 n=1 Tax=Phragmites australis TaxID=29695 RepID=UPI002D797C19|nr:uncharacterized protein LOC133921431 [Phragmites australis]XP_062222279.1 uncharacterized protein LOC133921431 [Phragmites australis]XP_062222280.1 uncharacterized protein LOC133921431 [Phragmites australis]XP_062222281.1 uncharacterized protein LOC133921431 [Phragmites australis]
MPTITHYVLDPFLETGSPAQTQKTASNLPPAPPDKATEKPIPVPAAPVRSQTSPAALYATPESTTLPDSPSSFPGTWSPYLVNHKRRGASLAKTLSQGDVESEGRQPNLPTTLPALPKRSESFEVQEPEFAFQKAGNGKAEGQSGVEETLNGQNGMLQKGKGSVKAENEHCQPEFEFQHGSLDALVRPVNVGRPLNGESDAFFELQDSLNVTSNTETDDAGAHERWWKPSSPLGTSVGTPGAEFYDAFEEISSDGGTRSSRCMDDDLREMRLSLLMEIERRKQAEEALENWQKEWKKLSHYLSFVALSLPSPSIAENTGGSSMDPGAELCQQITISQLVAAAIAQGLARAEVEVEMETVIAAKNFEIARLSDRVQYYEAANREMSQRNQEAIEMSRQQRNKRKNRQKWFWGSVGLAVTLGATAIAWSYLPSSSHPQASPDSNSASSD